MLICPIAYDGERGTPLGESIEPEEPPDPPAVGSALRRVRMPAQIADTAFDDVLGSTACGSIRTVAFSSVAAALQHSRIALLPCAFYSAARANCRIRNGLDRPVA